MPLSFDWNYFVPAALLLLLPGSVFQSKKLRLRGISRNWEGQWGKLVFQPHYMFDLIRAAAGGWLLTRGLPPLISATGQPQLTPLIIEGVLLLVAVTLQTLPCREEHSAYAPFAYVLGLAAGIAPPLVMGFALVVAVVTALGFHSPAILFVALGASLLATSGVFMSKNFPFSVVPLALAVSFPWLLSALFSRDLVVTHRALREEEEHAASQLR